MNIEEVANEYEKVNTGIYPEVGQTSIRDAFIDGAKWQKEQHKSAPGKYTEMDFESARNTFSEDVYNHNRKNKTPIDMVDLDDAFETGADWMEKQMMKEAVEGVVTNAGGEFGYDVADFRFDDNHTYSILLPHEEKRKYGDKVRIIVVKEDN